MIPMTKEDKSFPQIPMEQQDIPVQLSAVLAVVRSVGLYQDYESSGGDPVAAAIVFDDLYTRHPYHDREKHVTVNSRDLEICHQLPQVKIVPKPGNNIARLFSHFHKDGTERAMAMVSGEEHTPQSRTHCRCAEHHS